MTQQEKQDKFDSIMQKVDDLLFKEHKDPLEFHKLYQSLRTEVDCLLVDIPTTEK